MTYSNSPRPALCLVASLIFLAGCSGKDARIQSHMEKGESLLAQSEYDKAILEVRNVLQMDPKQARAYYLAGETEEARGDVQKAFGYYGKVLDIKPDFFDAKTGQARLELRVGDLVRAKAAASEVLAAKPGDAQAIIILASLRAREGDIDGATGLVGAIDGAAQLPPSASLLLAQFYAVQKKDPAAGQKIVDAALERQPRDLPLLLGGAEIAMQQNHDTAVISYFERAATTAPKDQTAWRAWAAYCDRAGKFDDAERVLRASIASEPEDSGRYLLLSQFLNERRGPSVALAELQKLSIDRPRDYRIQFALASEYRSYGRIDDARKQLEKIATADPTGEAGLSARNDLATLDLQAGRDEEARRRLDEILKLSPRNDAALTSRGQIELAHNQLDPAIADLRATAKDLPDSVPVLGLLVSAYQANKQADLARDTLADSVKLYPNRPELGLLLSEYYSRTGQPQQALAALDDVIRANPRLVRPYEIKAALQMSAKDASGAEATLHTLEVQYPKDPLGPMHLGEFFESQQKYALALAQYDRAAALAPSANGPRVAAISALLKAHQVADAERRVDKALEASPDDALELGLRGDVKTFAGEYIAAEAAYRKAIELQPNSVPLYVRMANMFARQKDFDSAIRVLDEGIKANPSDEKLLISEADYFQRVGHIDDAMARYNSVLDRNPGNSLAANNLAYMLTSVKGDKASLERALTLAQRFEYSGDPMLLDTLGWTRFKLGQTDEALTLLKRAESLSPKTPAIELHYGMVLYKSGDATIAREHLRFATESKETLPDLDEARRILAAG